MNQNIIEQYTNNNLSALLLKYGLTTSSADKIKQDINNRLASIISRWNNEKFRSTILFHGIEEASFYEPLHNEDVGALVVVGVRNSLIEDLASTNEAAMNSGYGKPIILDKHIKEITSSAISFFNDNYLDICNQDVIPPINDPFKDLSEQYPIAWEAMYQLSRCTKNTNYQKIDNNNIPQVNFEKRESSTEMLIEVQSGISPRIGDDLKGILDRVISGKQPFFFSDSFKMVTRHPEKLYKILELVLSSNAPFVTLNYFISNGYVSKRLQLLKPAHSEKEIHSKLKNKIGLRKVHLNVLNLFDQ